MDKDLSTGLKNTGIALVCMVLIAVAGMYAGWVAIPVAAVLGGGAAWLIMKKSKDRIMASIVWAAFAGLAALLFILFA